MEGTRVQLLANAMCLVTTRKGPHIIWISGMAGTGKTSIALTLCQMLCDDPTVLLGGTFFCSRAASSLEQADARRIIPTFATLLVRVVPACAAALAAELRKDPDLAHKSIRDQSQRLLANPLGRLVSLDRQLVFVIDALDQCSDQRQLVELVDALADFKSPVPVKFLVISRPDPRVERSRICHPNLRKVIELDTIDLSEVTADIRFFIQKSFENTPDTTKWYTEDDLDYLATLASGLFLFSAVVVGWILERNRLERLNIVKTQISTSVHAPSLLDQMNSLMVT